MTVPENFYTLGDIERYLMECWGLVADIEHDEPFGVIRIRIPFSATVEQFEHVMNLNNLLPVNVQAQAVRMLPWWRRFLFYRVLINPNYQSLFKHLLLPCVYRARDGFIVFLLIRELTR